MTYRYRRGDERRGGDRRPGERRREGDLEYCREFLPLPRGGEFLLILLRSRERDRRESLPLRGELFGRRALPPCRGLRDRREIGCRRARGERERRREGNRSGDREDLRPRDILVPRSVFFLSRLLLSLSFFCQFLGRTNTK